MNTVPRSCGRCRCRPAGPAGGSGARGNPRGDGAGRRSAGRARGSPPAPGAASPRGCRTCGSPPCCAAWAWTWGLPSLDAARDSPTPHARRHGIVEAGSRAYPEVPPRGYPLEPRCRPASQLPPRRPRTCRPRIVVVPPSADAGEIAREMAPPGFELVLARDGGADTRLCSAGAEYMVCYPTWQCVTPSIVPRRGLKLVQLLSAGYDDVDLEAARRASVPVSNNGGANAISVAEHALMLMLAVSRKVIWQHGNVAGGRWRGNGPAPRMYELLQQDARHRRPRHHRQEGGAAGAGLRHAGAVLRHRAAERGRGGRARRALPPAARAAQELRHRVAACAAQRLHARHDRRRRAGADEAVGRCSSTPRAGRWSTSRR